MRHAVRAGRAARQRGAAILTALVIVTLVATLASAMVWQQWRAVQIEAAERARAQAGWIIVGALDWARLILREDSRNNPSDNLGEPWAVPLAEARLSTFLAADRDRTDDAPEAFLSGHIEDVQGRYNLRNLIDDEGKPVAAELETLRRLFETVQASPDGADRLAQALAGALGPVQQRNDAAPLAPTKLQQLRWLGVEPELLARLRPFVALLPRRTPLNINTAPREVIAAVAGVDLATAERIVQQRVRNPLEGDEEVAALFAGLPQQQRERLAGRLKFTSSFFEIYGRLRLGDRVLEERSLVRRDGLAVTVLQRERVALVE